MPLPSIPLSDTLADKQYITISGADGIETSYVYDAQTRSLYFKESQVLFPSFHGPTHIAEDLIPEATCDLPGLMSADDKCKLDAMIQTRLGVVGFSGAGHPDDGGWMSGDIILATGTDFISIERLGNVIRFSVDSLIPLACQCEECTQIFWVQDETDISSIRPPTCGGKLPGINGYGEVKFYLFPESSLVDPNNITSTLNKKGQYPAFIFKRYDDAIVPGSAEHEMVLKRDTSNNTTTEVGWAFTPGATGVPEMIWYMGKDDDGNQVRFELEPSPTVNSLGNLLYRGHLISKKPAVIVNYTASVLSTNQYILQEWDVDNAAAIGDEITATNVWHYSNPLNSTSGSNPKTITLDSTIDVLPIGTLVDLIFFEVGEVNGEPIRRYYFSKRPEINPTYLWHTVGAVQFGDVVLSKTESTPGEGSEDKTASTQVSIIRDFERTIWGLTGYDDPVVSYEKATTAGTEGADISTQHRAVIDTALPGLKVVTSSPTPDNFSERPVYLWNRTSLKNAYLKARVGRPTSASFTPYDIILRAPVDSHTEKYMKVIGRGTLDGLHYIRVAGVHFHDLPQFGSLRVLYNEDNVDKIYNYNRKLVFPTIPDNEEGLGTNALLDPLAYADTFLLMGGENSNVDYPGDVGDIVELLHQEYNTTVVRIEFGYSGSTITTQFKVGMLDMSVAYENDVPANDLDDYVRGLAPGYTVSAIYSQATSFTGVGTKPSSSPDSFVVYDGGVQVGGSEDEYWNTVEVMVRDSQIWVWWNGLLVPPSETLSAALPTPVAINTPYFDVSSSETKLVGKFGLRLWPGSVVRSLEVRSQLNTFSEFTYGQILIS